MRRWSHVEQQVLPFPRADHPQVVLEFAQLGILVHHAEILAKQFADLGIQVELLQALIDAGADVTLKEDDGLTALDLAKRRDKADNVKVLEQAVRARR